MQKIYYYFEGGLGDVMIQYWENPWIHGLTDYLEANPSYVTAVLNAHNFQSADIFRANLDFSEIQVVPYTPSNREFLKMTYENQGFRIASDVVPKTAFKPKIQMFAEDHSYLRKILPPEGRFILLHAGAGKKSHGLHGTLNLTLLLDAARRVGKKIVMVGGASWRHPGLIMDPFGNAVDPKLINLVGKANPRLICEIIKQSSGVIATMSAYIWAALFQNKTALCIMPRIEDAYTQRLRKMGGNLKNFHQITNDSACYDELIKLSMKGSTK